MLRLQLIDFRAGIRQKQGAIRAGKRVGEVENLNAVKGREQVLSV
jgi:hypothetical protein